jgi:hypothetical protein
VACVLTYPLFHLVFFSKHKALSSRLLVQKWPSAPDFANTLGQKDGDVHLLFTGQRTADADAHLLHKSQFMLSLSSVKNYLNVWSGSIMFLPPKTNIT